MTSEMLHHTNTTNNNQEDEACCVEESTKGNSMMCMTLNETVVPAADETTTSSSCSSAAAAAAAAAADDGDGSINLQSMIDDRVVVAASTTVDVPVVPPVVQHHQQQIQPKGRRRSLHQQARRGSMPNMIDSNFTAILEESQQTLLSNHHQQHQMRRSSLNTTEHISNSTGTTGNRIFPRGVSRRGGRRRGSLVSQSTVGSTTYSRRGSFASSSVADAYSYGGATEGSTGIQTMPGVLRGGGRAGRRSSLASAASTITAASSQQREAASLPSMRHHQYNNNGRSYGGGQSRRASCSSTLTPSSVTLLSDFAEIHPILDEQTVDQRWENGQPSNNKDGAPLPVRVAANNNNVQQQQQLLDKDKSEDIMYVDMRTKQGRRGSMVSEYTEVSGLTDMNSYYPQRTNSDNSGDDTSTILMDDASVVKAIASAAAKFGAGSTTPALGPIVRGGVDDDSEDIEKDIESLPLDDHSGLPVAQVTCSSKTARSPGAARNSGVHGNNDDDGDGGEEDGETTLAALQLEHNMLSLSLEQSGLSELDDSFLFQSGAIPFMSTERLASFPNMSELLEETEGDQSSSSAGNPEESFSTRRSSIQSSIADGSLSSRRSSMQSSLADGSITSRRSSIQSRRSSANSSMMHLPEEGGIIGGPCSIPEEFNPCIPEEGGNSEHSSSTFMSSSILNVLSSSDESGGNKGKNNNGPSSLQDGSSNHSAPGGGRTTAAPCGGLVGNNYNNPCLRLQIHGPLIESSERSYEDDESTVELNIENDNYSVAAGASVADDDETTSASVSVSDGRHSSKEDFERSFESLLSRIRSTESIKQQQQQQQQQQQRNKKNPTTTTTTTLANKQEPSCWDLEEDPNDLPLRGPDSSISKERPEESKVDITS